jgi:hypothetical protein
MTRGRKGVVAVMLASLVAAGLTRQAASSYRVKTAPAGTTEAAAAGGTANGSRLSAMPSFATALLLGGLRGPLVMMLWTSSEGQKADKDLEDFDTKVEWIRLLQPEFDSVHIFQIWNKAYNISVQMASLANKYATILDALDYAHKTRLQRPNNINLEVAVADVYFNKLGSSTEKEYYAKRVRQETKWRQVVGPRQGDVGWRRTKLDPMLDQGGNILPEYREELQYLTKFEPFPHGLHPFALAYNYYRAAQILQSKYGQRHLQLSDQVLDSRPALTLKGWAEAELEDGRKVELQAFGKAVPAERLAMEQPTAALPVDAKPEKPTLMGDVELYYRRANQVSREAIDAYLRHLREYGSSQNLSTFSSHVDHLRTLEGLSGGDYAYVRAMRAAPGAGRDALVQEAREAYARAATAAQRTIMLYYTDADLLKYAHVEHSAIERMPAEQVNAAYGLVQQGIGRGIAGRDPGHAEDRSEYEAYLTRAATRLGQLSK